MSAIKSDDEWSLVYLDYLLSIRSILACDNPFF